MSVPNAEILTADLELGTLLVAMAAGDGFLWEVANQTLLRPLLDPEAIRYRQRAVVDCLKNPEVIRELYDIAVTAVEDQRKGYFGFFRDNPDSTLSGGIRLLELLVPMLRQLRAVADRHLTAFASPAFVRLFTMLKQELSYIYLDAVETHVRNLQPRRGVELAAGVGRVGEAVDYRVLRPRKAGWRDWIPPVLDHSSYGFQIPPRDDAGFQALSEMRGRGLNEVANAVAQSADHVRGFFRALRSELAFYVGCLNLAEHLTANGEPICIPEVAADSDRMFSATGLYDVALSLHLEERTVGNDVTADGKRLVFITGANQGGKSTFLRSVGLAQLMMQAGMFVPASSFRARTVTGIFTHYKREEDATMERGKLEEELSRMSEIADLIRPGALLLCNESFASTNEREGSEIGRQVARAMTESGVDLFYVTHLYDLAHGFETEADAEVLFLRAERRSDGSRSFKLVEAGPLDTSFGEDLYRRIFGPDDDLALGRSWRQDQAMAPTARSDRGTAG
ncbi:MAG: DNA mismatch repair protein MutS [Acidimicrobiia bacterium]